MVTESEILLVAAKQHRNKSTDTGILHKRVLVAEDGYSVFSSHIHVFTDLPSFDWLKKENWFLIKYS